MNSSLVSKVSAVLLIAVALVLHPAANSQSCSTAGTSPSVSCSQPGAKCGSTQEVGKVDVPGVCKTVSKVGVESSCSCVTAQAGSSQTSLHSLALRSKGGAGVVALSTFLLLVGLWSLLGVWRSRSAKSA
jgi:hypothetical protein